MQAERAGCPRGLALQSPASQPTATSVSTRSYPAAAHTADAVVVRVTPHAELEVLLWQRRLEPYVGYWALPGGFLQMGESLEASVRRHLAAKVGVSSVGHLEQLETSSDPHRDPRGWVITTAYLALVRADLGSDTPSDTAWHPATCPPALAFDHQKLIQAAIERLRGKLSYSNIAFALAPARFSISQLATIYKAVLGYEVSHTNLQRVLERDGLIQATTERRTPGASGGRPAALYRFCDSHLVISKPLAAFRPR